MSKTNRVIALLICVVMLLGMLPTSLFAGEADGNVAYQLAESFAPGKTYVIVAEGKYALNSNPVSYAGQDTLGSSAVTIEDGKITSEITEDML